MVIAISVEILNQWKYKLNKWIKLKAVTNEDDSGADKENELLLYVWLNAFHWLGND